MMALLKLAFRCMFPQCPDIDCEQACPRDRSESVTDDDSSRNPVLSSTLAHGPVPGIADLTGVTRPVPSSNPVAALSHAPSRRARISRRPIARANPDMQLNRIQVLPANQDPIYV